MGAGASLDEMPSHQVGRSVGAHAGRSVDLLAIKLAKLSEVPSTRNPAAATQPGFSQPSPRRLIAGQVQDIQPQFNPLWGRVFLTARRPRLSQCASSKARA